MRPNLVILILILLIACKSSELRTTNASDKDDVLQEVSLTSPWLDYRASYSRKFDLLHTSLDLRFDWMKKKVLGNATLTITPYFYDDQYLTIDAKQFDVQRVLILDLNDSLELEHDYDGEVITLDLGRLYSRKDTINIHIEYEANPSQNSGYDDKGLYFVNPDSSHSFKPQQIWTQGETEYNSRWFPTLDQPNERFTQDIKLTVKEEFKTLSNGELIWSRGNNDGTRTDFWRLDLPHAPYLAMVAIGDWEVVEDNRGDVPIRYWVEPSFRDQAMVIFGNTPEMMDYFSDILSFPYPWPNYDQIIVRDFVTGAMENTTSSVYMENLAVDSSFFEDEHWDEIISHELFHQWFGNVVTCESWSNLPLNEALANYGEHLWLEYKYGRDEAAYHGMEELDDYLYEASTEKKELIRFYYEDPDDMFDNHSYAKGSRVIHMLRNYVGDEAFFTSLHHYLINNQFESVELNDFRKSFEHVTGEDLNWFFTQWFLYSGHPELEVQHDHSNDTLYIEVFQRQDIIENPLYYLPIYMDIAFDDSLYRYPLQIIEEYHKFRLPTKRKPQMIIIDGDHQLTGTITHIKTEEELYDQIRLSDTFEGKYKALLDFSDRDTLTQMTLKAIDLGLNDSSEIIKELALSMIAYSDDEKLLEFTERIKELTRSNSSKVRTAAILAGETLDILSSEEWKDYLDDPSFLVRGVALEYLLSRVNIESRDLFFKYRDHENINIIIPIGTYINKVIQKGYVNWYKNTLLKAKSGDLFFLIQLLTDYLLVAPDEEKSEVVDILFGLGLDHHNYVVRLAAFQGLLAIEFTDTVSEKLTILKASEKDVRLLEIYAQY